MIVFWLRLPRVVCQVLVVPVSEVYLEKAFDGTGYRPAQPLPVARELGETSIMFLVHPTLTAAEIDKTCAVLQEVMGLATQV